MGVEKNNNSSNYIEGTKVQTNEHEKMAKRQKAKVWGSNIAYGLLSILVSGIFASKGMNFFGAFLKAFSLPTILMILYNVRYLVEKKKHENSKEPRSR